jgi:tetratricopeptide (TPR) repeat protein
LNTGHSLALIYSNLNEFDKSLNLYERVYEGRNRVLGSVDVSTLISGSNLAYLYHLKGDNEKAKELYEKIYELDQKVLGEEDSETLSVAFELADIYYDENDFAKAIILYDKIYNIRERVLGLDSYSTIEVGLALALSYHFVDQNEMAIELYETVLEARERILEQEEPMDIFTLSNMVKLTDIYTEQGETEKVLALKEKVKNLSEKMKDLWEKDLAQQIEIKGMEVFKTFDIRQDLANVYFFLEDYAKAEEIFEELLVCSRDVLGLNHPDTIEITEMLELISKKKLNQTDLTDFNELQI